MYDTFGRWGSFSLWNRLDSLSLIAYVCMLLCRTLSSSCSIRIDCEPSQQNIRL